MSNGEPSDRQLESLVSALPPLITTKLRVPRRRDAATRRDRLVQQLESGATAKLTLVAAAAGFGKTTALTDWIAAAGESRSVAWVSLDARDSTPGVFWRYVLAAVNTAMEGAADEALALLSTPGTTTEAALATLINDLDAHSREMVIVLDDFHVIGDPQIHADAEFLVDNLPVHTQLVIASRVDPPLPLARLRARRELVEVRTADLRFTPAEASTYLNDSMGLALDDHDVGSLEDRTEGWIAALQLAALSLHGRADSTEFIAGFAGDDRFVVDYLIEEVLQRQTADVRAFLLRTSILSQLSGDLVDAVTGGSEGAATLESLDRANLFIVPLDDQRHWYRYHHLFAQMLRARLVAEAPGDVADLHLRASTWCAEHGQIDDAISHAIDADAFDRAADLIQAATPKMRRSRQEATLVRWLESLPPETIRSRPALSVELAGTLLSVGRADGVDELLRDAEATMGDGAEIQAVRRGIALYRAAQSLALGDITRAARDAATAVELAGDGDELSQGSAAGVLGLALWTGGDLAAAESTWADSLRHLERAGHLSDMIGGSIAICDIQVAQGRIGAALDTSWRALDLATQDSPALRGAADMRVAIADILRERGDLEAARTNLDEAIELGEYAGLPQNRHRRRVASARLLVSEGDPLAAVALFDEAERLYTADFFPDTRPIAAQRVHALLASGRAQDARDWARRSGLTPEGPLTYLREFEYLTLARVLMSAPGDGDDGRVAVNLLERMLPPAEAGGRGRSVLEIRGLLSLALQATGRSSDAVAVLRTTLRLAEPEGWVRVFADEGQPMARLLTVLSKRESGNAYLRRLARATTTLSTPSVTSALVAPLSDRELEVLRLLATDLGGADIARHLSVSVNTMRTHTKNIYVKLGVTSRRAAVIRAAELGLPS